MNKIIMKVLTIVVLITAMLVTITSCDQTKKAIETAGTVELSGDYKIASIAGATLETKDLTLAFRALNKTVSGHAGCNDFSANYSLDVFALSVGQITATEAYCDDPIMKTERAYMQAVANAGSYTLKNGLLALYSKTDRTPVLTATKIK